MSDREGYLKRRDQLLMQDEQIAELEAALAVKEVTQLNYAPNYHRALKRVETLEVENKAQQATIAELQEALAHASE